MIDKKRILLVSLLVGALVSPVAQDKVIDQSVRKRPAWVGASSEEYIVASSEGYSLDVAKSKALTAVRDRIVNSVATVVRSQSDLQVNETTNDQLFNYLEIYNQKTTQKTADQNFVKGISEAKIVDYYWTKVLNKKTGQTNYHYHIKYAFSKSELDQLIAEFEARDREMSDRLDQIDTKVNTFGSVEEVLAAIVELEEMVSYFPDQRKTVARTSHTKLTQMLRSTAAQILSNRPGELRIALNYDGRTIRASRPPAVKSNCCDIRSVKQEDGVWTIQYGFDGCFDDLENSIDVAFSLGVNTRLKAIVNLK